MGIFRSSHQRWSIKKDVLKNFAKFAGKHMCQGLFFDKVAGLRPATLLKKETLGQVFSCEFCDTPKSIFFTEHLWTTASGMLLCSSLKFSIYDIYIRFAQFLHILHKFYLYFKLIISCTIIWLQMKQWFDYALI